MTSSQRVLDAARALGLDLQLVTFPQPTRTAQEAADAIGCDVSQIVKSLCFVAEGAPVMILVAGHNRLDEKKLAAYFGVSHKKVKRANATQVKETTGYAIGGVAPFGHPITIPILMDEELFIHDEVWAAAGTPYTVFPIEPAALAETTNGVILDIKQN